MYPVPSRNVGILTQTFRIAAPEMAPKHWKITYKAALIGFILLATNIPVVTAGFLE